MPTLHEMLATWLAENDKLKNHFYVHEAHGNIHCKCQWGWWAMVENDGVKVSAADEALSFIASDPEFFTKICNQILASHEAYLLKNGANLFTDDGISLGA